MAQRDTSNDVAMNKKDLLQWMKRHGKDAQGLADLLGLTKTGVNYWITGKRDIPEPIGRILNFFDNYPNSMENF